MPILLWLEDSGLSVWLRESPSLFAFPGVLFLHTLGLAMLVGPNVAINLALLDRKERIPPEPLRGLYPLMWSGFWINAASGALLLLAYPTKAVTNPLFFAKLALVAYAMMYLQWLKPMLRDLPANAPDRRRRHRMAVTSLALWAGAILFGRLLAYTYSTLMATDLV
ncbi:MAG: hypothetical protein H6978_14875 [Gammaproteobacteria bacterium]|nr:hypothetical protein [Gammaproteobacteria bacterium]